MKLGVVEILVKNFEKCLRFYKDLLGLKIEHADKQHKFIMFNTGTTKLAIYGASKFYRDKFSHIKLYFPTKDIEKTVKELKNKNVKFISKIEKRHWGRVISFTDPENNEHYLYEESR